MQITYQLTGKIFPNLRGKQSGTLKPSSYLTRMRYMYQIRTQIRTPSGTINPVPRITIQQNQGHQNTITDTAIIKWKTPKWIDFT